jgi:hypothetical protein
MRSRITDYIPLCICSTLFPARLGQRHQKEWDRLEKQVTERWADNRVEDPHAPFRRKERATLRFRRMHSLQKFTQIHASFHNLLNKMTWGRVCEVFGTRIKLWPYTYSFRRKKST